MARTKQTARANFGANQSSSNLSRLHHVLALAQSNQRQEILAQQGSSHMAEPNPNSIFDELGNIIDFSKSSIVNGGHQPAAVRTPFPNPLTEEQNQRVQEELQRQVEEDNKRQEEESLLKEQQDELQRQNEEEAKRQEEERVLKAQQEEELLRQREEEAKRQEESLLKGQQEEEALLLAMQADAERALQRQQEEARLAQLQAEEEAQNRACAAEQERIIAEERDRRIAEELERELERRSERPIKLRVKFTANRKADEERERQRRQAAEFNKIEAERQRRTEEASKKHKAQPSENAERNKKLKRDKQPWDGQRIPPPPTVEKKKRRWRPGTVALREIRKYQKSADPIMSKAPFGRLVKEVIDEYSDKVTRIQSTAVGALQEATETLLVSIFQDSVLCHIHAKRVTLKPVDMALALRLRQDDCLDKLGKHK